MAIIAILATAGLSAYTGYIKKARDATRLADLSAINTIIQSALSTTGMPPQTTSAVYGVVTAANNGTILMDPLATNNGLTTQSVCFGSTSSITGADCSYTYRVCDGGMGYAVGTRFESASNIPLYIGDGMPNIGAWNTNVIYEIGNCRATCTFVTTGGIPGCPTTGTWDNVGPTKIDSDGLGWIGTSL